MFIIHGDLDNASHILFLEKMSYNNGFVQIS